MTIRILYMYCLYCGRLSKLLEWEVLLVPIAVVVGDPLTALRRVFTR